MAKIAGRDDDGCRAVEQVIDAVRSTNRQALAGDGAAVIPALEQQLRAASALAESPPAELRHAAPLFAAATRTQLDLLASVADPARPTPEEQARTVAAYQQPALRDGQAALAELEEHHHSQCAR